MNKPMTCVIVDDEPLAIRLLRKHVTEVPSLQLVETFTNPVKALDFLSNNHVDILLLDIQMPLITGIDFVRSLPYEVNVILTTAYRDYAVDSYELAVVDYLVKPITFPRFLQSIRKCEKRHQKRVPMMSPAPSTANDHIYINVNKRHQRVNFTDINYIESIKDYVRIHTQDQRLMTKLTLGAILKLLPENDFVRIHRSFIVNISKITAYTAHDVELDTTELPIGTVYKQQFLQKIKA